ncbi:MAG: hypothetical protein J6V40_04555, partial [Clostridia bacterium]|nr:hypothetical protein [Clostridia bacterium]
FPARFDALLEEYFPEEYANGVNADTLIRLLNSVKSTIAEQGYEAGFVDSIIDTLNQIRNLVTVTFSDLATVAPKKVGVYLLAAVVFDPDYMPKANMGIVVIQPTVTMSDMVWNYTDDNGIITVPAMQKMDMTATIVGEGADQEISYIFFGFNAEGKFTKLTDMSALTEGAWLQLAYVKTDISATMNFVKPIARMFVVVPQSAIVTIDDANNNHLLLRTYNGSAHTITASATTLNGTPLDNAHMVITYVGVDSLGNKYNSTVAPTNAGIYTVIATYIKQNNGATVYVGFDVAELVIALADSDEIVVTDSVVCYDEAAHNVNVELDSNYAYTYVYVTNNTLNVVLPESWDIALDDAKLNYVLDIIKEKYDINEITYNNVLPTEIGTYNIAVIAYRENYKLAYAEATLTINDHDLVAHEAQAPTCTEFGWEAYNTCANCDYTTYVQIAALGHDAVVDAAVAATCTATGLTEGSHCDRCGATLVAQETVAIIPHNTVSHEALAPTCLEAGHNAYETCVDCAYTTYEEIAALGHHAVVDAAVAATCTATGLTEGSHCDRCGAILVAQEKVAIIPHSTVNHNGMAATCTVSGYAPYVTCEHCDYTTYQVIPALGHNEVVDAAVAPTCTSNGLTAGSHCDRCDEILVAQDTINMIPHTHSDLLVITPATCTEQGLSHKICLVCHTELGNFNIPALGHATISHPSKAPTCTEGGWFAHVTCGRCDYTTYSPIAALGHSVVIDPAVAPTCVSTGLTAGSHCGTCNHIINAQQLVETTDHNYSAWIVVTPATSTNNGRYERSCNVCQHTEYQVIPAYGDKNMGNIDVTEGENGKVTIDEESVTDAIKENEETGKNEVVINASTSQDSLTNVEMNTSSLQQIVDANSSLTIKTSDIYATFDNAALDTIMSATNGETSVEFDLKKIENDQLTDAQVSALSNKNVVNIISAQIVCGDSTISNFGAGRVQVRIPFALDENKSVSDYKIIYIADDGSIEELETEYVNGEFVVELEHFSEYAVVDVSDSSVKVSPYVILAILAPFALLAIYVVFDSLRTLAIVRKGRKH